MQLLKPLTGSPREYKIIGADLEGDAQKGVLVIALVSDDFQEVFHDANDFWKFIRGHRFRGARVFFHNLRYDWGVLYPSCPYHWEAYDIDGRLIKVLIKIGSKTRLTFLDSSNFFPGLSIAQLGRGLGIPKYPTPPFLKFPEEDVDTPEWYCENHNKLWCLECYCLRDAEICYKAMSTFQQGILRLGGELGNTLASTAMKLFKRSFLEEEFFTPFQYRNEYARNGYYGGRVENFVRGWWDDIHVLDINSAYPCSMLNEDFPHPNYLVGPVGNPGENVIWETEGISEVEIEIPVCDVPPLPFRWNGYLIYPVGVFRGHWTHKELRFALEHGARLRRIYTSLYSTQTCAPFQKYVQTLYQERMRYKQKGSFYQLVYKILLNSLYGKLAQRTHTGLRKLRQLTEEDDELPDGVEVYTLGDEEFIAEDVIYPQPDYINVLWAAYVTASLRIQLAELIMSYWPQVYYADTDGLHTRASCESSDELGGLKEEYVAHRGLYVNPKEYLLVDEKGNPLWLKAKGVPPNARLDYLLEGQASFYRPIGWREGMKRRLPPSLWIEVVKLRRHNIPKRKFVPLEFNPRRKQRSEPWEINEFIMHTKKVKSFPLLASV